MRELVSAKNYPIHCQWNRRGRAKPPCKRMALPFLIAKRLYCLIIHSSPLQILHIVGVVRCERDLGRIHVEWQDDGPQISSLKFS